MARQPASDSKTEDQPISKTEQKPRPHPPKHMDWASL